MDALGVLSTILSLFKQSLSVTKSNDHNIWLAIAELHYQQIIYEAFQDQ